MTEQDLNANRQPVRYAVLAMLTLLLALTTVGVIGVVENMRLKDSASKAIQYDVAVSAASDDLRVAVMDLRYDHRNIVLSGPTNQNIAAYDASYQALTDSIDLLEELDISELAVPQPDQLHAVATAYYDTFRPSIALFTSDPIAFNRASDVGLAQLDELATMAEVINDAGNDLTAQSLQKIETAANRERWILISLLVGVALVGALLVLAAVRTVQRLQAANDAQQSAAQQLEESLRMKSHFIADASHELRTPITLIRGNAELSMATAESPEQRESLKEIYAESTRMSSLVNDLLFLARSDAGTVPLDLEYLPVGLIMAQIRAPAGTLLERRQIRLEIADDAHGHIRADRSRIEQALLILVDNAAKFSPSGTVVSLESFADVNTVRFEVVDHGPGIPAEERDRVFDRFYQVRGNSRSREGSGIGLSIARSIVESHGGTITIGETPGGGATFTIALPLASD